MFFLWRNQIDHRGILIRFCCLFFLVFFRDLALLHYRYEFAAWYLLATFVLFFFRLFHLVNRLIIDHFRIFICQFLLVLLCFAVTTAPSTTLIRITIARLRLFVTFLRVLRLVDFFLLFFYNFMKPIHSSDNLLLFHNRLRIVQLLGFIVLIILVGRQLTVSILVNILLVDLFSKYFRLGLLLKIYEIFGQLPLILP